MGERITYNLCEAIQSLCNAVDRLVECDSEEKQDEVRAYLRHASEQAREALKPSLLGKAEPWG